MLDGGCGDAFTDFCLDFTTGYLRLGMWFGNECREKWIYLCVRSLGSFVCVNVTLSHGMEMKAS